MVVRYLCHGLKKNPPHSVRVRYADLVGGQADEVAVFTVQTAELHILVAVGNEFDIPQTGDGRPEGARNVTQR